MTVNWSYTHWRPGGERARFGEVAFDSSVHCGNGHDFVQLAGGHRTSCGHFRFRARVHLAPYAWRFLFRIDSPGAGREITLEVADFNHTGRTPWHESATACSEDGETWLPFDTDRLEIVDWTPTGHPEIDNAYGDAEHIPYGVRYRLRLGAPTVWFACPTPFTLQHRDALLRHLAALHPELVETAVVAESAHSARTRYPVKMARITAPGDLARRRRVFVIAGEHPAETAGMYACEGWMREVLDHPDWLRRYVFFFVPVLNVDGVLFGRTYCNVSPGITDGVGVNLSATWDKRPCPEHRGLWQALTEIRPDLLVSLHNGRHRREMEQFSDSGPATGLISEALRRHLAFGLVDAGPTREGRLARVSIDAGLTDLAFLTETLLLCKLPEAATFAESYLEVGRQLARGYLEGLDAL